MCRNRRRYSDRKGSPSAIKNDSRAILSDESVSLCDAWAKHDGHELAKIMADDVDFVTVATVYLHGRADFEKFHSRLLSGRFRDSTITSLESSARFVRPDMAVALRGRMS